MGANDKLDMIVKLHHININHSMRYSNLERQEAMLMAWIPSSLINFLMRSHHTDKNSTNNTTDDDFLPLALPLLQPVKDITSDLLSQCPDICFSIVQNSDIY